MPADAFSYVPVRTGQSSPMLRLETILGLATAPDIAEALHQLEHRGQVETGAERRDRESADPAAVPGMRGAAIRAETEPSSADQVADDGNQRQQQGRGLEHATNIR